MKKKLYIKTHGCQMNEYDSAKMADLLKEKEGFELAKNEDDADLLILNTCSIREKAQEKVFHQIGRWRKIKEEKPDLKIAIGGCVASQEGKEIINRAPAVDIVFGPQTLHKLPELYNNKSIAMSIFSQSASATQCSKGENSTSVTIDPRLHRIMVVNSIHNGASLKSRRELATVAGGETLMLEGRGHQTMPLLPVDRFFSSHLPFLR